MKREWIAFKLLTTSDVAGYCGVTSVTVSRWIRGGKLKAYTTPGGHYRIRKQDFREFLESSGLLVDERYFSINTDLRSEDQHGEDPGS